MRNVKVSIWGFGAMGQGMAKMILSKKGIELTGICDLNPNYKGKSVNELLHIESELASNIHVTDKIEEIVFESSCDVCIIATDSFTVNNYDKIIKVVENKINVISTAEEMSYPAAQNPDLAVKINSIAKKHGVSVLGTGINPGLMMDLLAICLTGAMEEVESIECERVNSLSPFGHAVMEEQGVGSTIEEFKLGVQEKTISGHIGFPESIMMISDALGFDISEIKQQIAPIVTNKELISKYGHAAAGHVAGVKMSGQGIQDGKEIIKMIHPQQIEPEVNTGDYIRIKGTPDINMSISPEVDGGIGTIAMCVNMIPHIINARPGLKTMIDLPVPRAIMGDVRKLIEIEL